MNKRNFLGILFVIHGLAHSGAGMWGADRGSAWLVTPLWIAAEAGFIAAGLGLMGGRPFARAWEQLAIVAALSSILLLSVFGELVFMGGLVLDAGILVLGLIAGESALLKRAPRATAPPHRVRRVAFNVFGVALVGWVALVIAVRQVTLNWGSTSDDRTVQLIGDDIVREPHYKMDHVVTIHAPADAVWPWVAQLGQDRGGFYSYDWLERLAGDHIRNADHVNPAWTNRAAGDLVRATQPEYLGGRFGPDIGWRITQVEPGRAMVLKDWGAFVVRPVDATTSKLHVRLRGPGSASWVGAIAGPFGLLVFEPAHFIMERGMLLGIKRRAEASSGERSD